MSDIKVYVLADTRKGEPAGWSAVAEGAGTETYYGWGNSPAEAFARLAKVLAEELRQWEGSGD